MTQRSGKGLFLQMSVSLTFLAMTGEQELGESEEQQKKIYAAL